MRDVEYPRRANATALAGELGAGLSVPAEHRVADQETLLADPFSDPEYYH